MIKREGFFFLFKEETKKKGLKSNEASHKKVRERETRKKERKKETNKQTNKQTKRERVRNTTVSQNVIPFSLEKK